MWTTNSQPLSLSPASVIGGAKGRQMAKPERIRSSVTVKLMVVSAVFLIVPALLYGRFEQADAERKQLMVTNLQIQGLLAAQALQEKLIAAGPRAPVERSEER